MYQILTRTMYKKLFLILFASAFTTIFDIKASQELSSPSAGWSKLKKNEKFHVKNLNDIPWWIQPYNKEIRHARREGYNLYMKLARWELGKWISLSLYHKGSYWKWYSRRKDPDEYAIKLNPPKYQKVEISFTYAIIIFILYLIYKKRHFLRKRLFKT